jgi:peptidoglycan/xylan/chitin deacetylase (PgdA/CDA1 family)
MGPPAGSVPPILTYHKIDTRFEWGFTQLAPRVFRRQVEALAARRYRFLGSEELGRCVARAEAPADALVLTFDDGYAALERHAFPVLADHGLRALVFVITDYVGRENSWDVRYGWRRFAHLSWDQLARWRERGIEVHSHGATHARLPWLSDGEIADELGRSREAIRHRLGGAPTALSYPFGAVDARVRRLALDAGYALGFAGPAVRGTGTAPDPLRLPRRPVYGWDRRAVPLVLGRSRWSPVGLRLAAFANRCAVGTAAVQWAMGWGYRRRGPGAAR